VRAPYGARPSAVPIGRRKIAATVGDESGGGLVKVVMLGSSGDWARVVRVLQGRSQPVMTGGGRRAWILMLRRSDGHLVSRRFAAGSGWRSRDRIELRATPARSFSWPNTPRGARYRLRVLLQGQACPNKGKANGVLAYERKLG
jgi:hypothetical protein